MLDQYNRTSQVIQDVEESARCSIDKLTPIEALDHYLRWNGYGISADGLLNVLRQLGFKIG